MRRIANKRERDLLWILQDGRICGQVVDGESIVTSRVIALDGETVSTEKGSKYVLSKKGDWKSLEEYLKKMIQQNERLKADEVRD